MWFLRRVSGTSMAPTLRPGKIVLAAHRLKRTRPGDVIIFEHDGIEKIKRVSQVRPREMFVTGDNATDSIDSRQFGWINSKTVKGKVIWPTTRQSTNALS